MRLTSLCPYLYLYLYLYLCCSLLYLHLQHQNQNQNQNLLHLRCQHHLDRNTKQAYLLAKKTTQHERLRKVL